MKGKRFLWLFVFAFFLLAGPFFYFLDLGPALGGAACGTIVVGIALKTWLDKLSKSQVSQSYYPLFQSVVDADALAAHCLAAAETRLKEQRTGVAKRRDDEHSQARSKYAKTISTAGNLCRDEKLRQINETYARRMVDIQTKQQVDLREAIEAHNTRKAEVREQAESGPRKPHGEIRVSQGKDSRPAQNVVGGDGDLLARRDRPRHRHARRVRRNRRLARSDLDGILRHGPTASLPPPFRPLCGSVT